MTLFGFMAIVPPATNAPRVQELADAIRTSMLHLKMQGKALAHSMGLSEAHLSRQLNEQGVNAARLLNAGEEFWRHFLKPFTELAGLTGDQVLEIFGAKADVKKQDELERRIVELERQNAEQRQLIAEVLKRLPQPKEESRVA